MHETIDLIAHYDSFVDFEAAFEKVGESLSQNDISVVLNSGLANYDLRDRYLIANYLLDRGARAIAVDEEGSGAFRILLSRPKHDVHETTELCRRLIGAGADINLPDKKGVLPANEIVIMGGIDVELSELYDWLFSLPNLDLTSKSKFGYNLLESARLMPHRAGFAQRMEEYYERENN